MGAVRTCRLIDNLMVATEARTHGQLATMTGLSRATISRMVHGESRAMSLYTLSMISHHTGIKVSTMAAWWADESE